MDFLIKSALENMRKDQEVAVDQPRILVIGVGGAGNNSVDRLYRMGIQGAKVVAVNTDKQHLESREADEKILIGPQTCRGLGAGGYPEIGRKAAEESREELRRIVSDADMVFIVAGMGGGTGTGAAPVIAELAREAGAIVIGVVTMPFKMERARVYKAESGLYELRRVADTVIVIDNNRLLQIAGNLPINQAFAVADELIATMIKGIVETIAIPSLVNLDYADVKAIMSSGGVAVIGVGEASGEHRAEEAAKKALLNPLLDVDYNGASGALVQITGDENLTLEEASKIVDIVTQGLKSDAQVIFGVRTDPAMQGRVRVIAIITGVKSPHVLGPVKVGEPSPKAMEVTNALGLKILA